MKRCWKCVEEIQDAALVCRFCGAEQRPAAVSSSKEAGNGLIKIGGIVLAVIIVAALANRSNDTGSSEPRPVAETPNSISSPAQIDPGVYQPYTAEGGWSKTLNKWGTAGIKRVQSLREAAAETVARDPKCDAVEISEISDTRSTPPTKPVVFVDCGNGERFYLGEDDVHYPTVSEKEKGARFSSTDLIARCTEEVKVRLSLPSTFDRKMFTVSDYQGTSGNRVIQFDFEAGNRMGATLPAKARCIMTTQGAFEVTVVEG